MKKRHYTSKWNDRWMKETACGRLAYDPSNDPSETTCQQCLASTPWYEANFQKEYVRSKS